MNLLTPEGRLAELVSGSLQLDHLTTTLFMYVGATLSEAGCSRFWHAAHLQIISQLDRLGTALESSNAPTLDTGPSKELARAGEDITAASSTVAAGGFGAGRARRMQGQAGISRQAVGGALSHIHTLRGCSRS